MRSRLFGRQRAGHGQPYRALLANREYRLLFSGLAISFTGSWAYNVGLVVFVFNITHSATWVAVASMTRFLTALLASAVGGVVADRLERVRLLVRLDVCATTFQALLTVTAVLDGPVVLAILLAALTAVTMSFYDPAVRAVTPALVGEDGLAAANSALAAVDNLSIIIGPAIGGILLLVGSPALVFGVNAASFAISGILVSRMRTRSRPADITEGGSIGPLRQMAAGIGAFTESSTVSLLAGFSILASFVYGTDTVLFAVISRDRLGTGSNGYGYLLAALGAGGLIMAPLMNRISASRRLSGIIVLGMTVYCAPTALLAVVTSPGLAAAIQVVRGAGTIVVDVLAITALQRLVKPDVVARVFGVFFALVLAAVALGALVVPLLLGVFGLSATLLVMAFAIPALAWLAFPRLRALDARAADQLAQMDPRVAMLQELDIFSGATRSALERLARSVVEVTVEAGAVIIHEGAVPDSFFVLVAGEVEVLGTGESGVERALSRMSAPNYFGEIGLLENRPRTATVRALSRVALFRIEGSDFVESMTATSVSPAALERVRTQLARTHPSLLMSFGEAGPG